MIQFKYTPETWDTPLGPLSDPSPLQEMTMTLSGEGTTWEEATREFHNFLRAAGFVIPYDLEWYEDSKEEDDYRDPLQKLTDWEEKYRPEELEVVKTFDKPECVGIIREWGRIEWLEDITPHLGAELYMAPPEREWVGLTEDDILDAIQEWKFGPEPHTVRDMLRSVEAKLKEKNSP